MYLKFLLFVFFCCMQLSTLPASGIPVVTVEEKLRIEEIAYTLGESEERFMENASLGVFKEAEAMLNFDSKHTVTLLVGKGYKGGSALRAGCLLLQKGYRLQADLLAALEECPPICQQMALEFQNLGGTLHRFAGTIADSDLIIDGLVGTGFKGAAKGVLLQMITAANQSGQVILAIDIPSGLNANTGEVETAAIQATRTATMGLPKIGFFMRKGIKQVGQLSVVDIGLPQKSLQQIQSEAYLFFEMDSSEILMSDPILISHDSENIDFAVLQNSADQLNRFLMLKSRPTFIFRPNDKPFIIVDLLE